MAAPTSRVELDELHVLEWQAGTGHQTRTVTSARVSARAREVGAAIATVDRNTECDTKTYLSNPAITLQ